MKWENDDEKEEKDWMLMLRNGIPVSVHVMLWSHCYKTELSKISGWHLTVIEDTMLKKNTVAAVATIITTTTDTNDISDCGTRLENCGEETGRSHWSRFFTDTYFIEP